MLCFLLNETATTCVYTYLHTLPYTALFRSALLGISQGAATSIRYAVRHPERVSHLILYGGYAVGGNRSDDPERRALFNAVMDVVGLGWGSRSEEHTSELQSLMRNSYAVFWLKKKTRRSTM